MQTEKVTAETFTRLLCARSDLESMREKLARTRAGLTRITQRYEATGVRGGQYDAMAAHQAALEELEAEYAQRKLQHLRDLAAVIAGCAGLDGLMSEVIWDRYVDGRSVEAIAAARHYSDGYIKNLIFKGRCRLMEN